MCGIHGVISSKTGYNKSLNDFVTQSFTANSLRGMDSSGVFQIGPSKGSVFIHKDAVNGTEFVGQKEVGPILRDVDGSLFTVCHVRAKTQGAVVKENAHPFIGWTDKDERVIGVHNGSLHNWKTRKGGSEYDVDSEWAIQQIAERGHAAISEFQGAFALVYWDEEAPRKINFVRNSERPMHFLFSKDGKHMLFASEAGMLAWLATRVKFEHDGVVRELPVGTVVTFDTSGDKLTWDTTKIKLYSAPVYNGVYAGQGNRTYQGSSYNAVDAERNQRPSGIVRMETEWLAFLKEGKEPTPNSSNVRPLCEVGTGCGGDFHGAGSEFADEEWANWGRESLTTHTTIEPDFILPSNIIPPDKHLEVEEAERSNAVLAGVFGAVVDVTWDGFFERGLTLTGTTNCPKTKSPFDVVLRNVKKSVARNLNGSTDSYAVIGIESDGTIIVHRLTKRMRAVLSV